MLAGMSPELDDQAYSFAVLGEGEQPPELAFATISEDEGATVILPMGKAQSEFARITLQVHSSLEGVGLTAAVSTALAKAGIACNVVAAFHHDHLFVPWERREEAMEILQDLSAQKG
jgi:hypothetical protein